MLDKVWLSAALCFFIMLSTVKSWGKFERHPMAISIATLFTTIAGTLFIITSFIKIWATN